MTGNYSDGTADVSAGCGVALTKLQQVKIVVSMYLGYATFMLLRMIPTVAGNSITANPELNVTTGDWGRILAVGTVGAVIGKFVGGLASDKFGGRLTFFFGLIVTALGVAAFAVSRTVIMFQTTFFIALLAKSAGWPAMTKIIESSFRPTEYGRVWGVLATSSRVGTLVATFVLGGLLGVLAWQSMLYLAAAAGIVMAVVFLVTQQSPQSPEASSEGDSGRSPEREALPSTDDPSSSVAAEHPLHRTTLPQAIEHFVMSRQFWLITFSLMGLTIMWDFLLMVPLYLTQTFELSESAASKTASAFPFGSLISVLVGGFVFDKLSRRATAWVMAVLLTVAALCVLTFYLMPQMNLTDAQLTLLSLALLFVFGLCVSPCYYIPMSVFSIEFGGPHSGFLIALLDALAFGVTAVFYFFAGDLAEHSWSLFLLVLFGVCLWAMLTTFLFLLGEARRLVAHA